MKIAIIINDLCIRGGTHKQVLRLCQYLKSHNLDFGLYTKYYDPEATYPEFKEFSIVSLKQKATEFSGGGSIIERYKRSRIKKMEDRQLFDLIPEDVDIYNFHDNGMLWMMKWAKTERGAKVVWQINDLPECFRVWVSDAHEKSIAHKISRMIYRKVLPCVDRITVNVSKNKDRVFRLMGRNADVLYCGVDNNSELITHCYKGNKEPYNILTAGVFFPRRNYETLIDVIDYLRRQGKRVRLDIIGSTELDRKYSNEIADQIKRLRLTDYITIWGQVDEIKYNQLFNEADIFSFININQSWGLAVFEAMSCGLPTIVSNSVGAIEILHDRQDSIVVEPTDVKEISDVITELIENSVFYNRISEKASEVVKDYTWDKLYSSKMVDIFNELMEGGI